MHLKISPASSSHVSSKFNLLNLTYNWTSVKWGQMENYEWAWLDFGFSMAGEQADNIWKVWVSFHLIKGK